MQTKTTSASVRILRSHDYNHFETSMHLENEQGISVEEIEQARKKCAMLCDQAVDQYKEAIMYEHIKHKLIGSENYMKALESHVAKIKEVQNIGRTQMQKNILKIYEKIKNKEDWHYDMYHAEPSFNAIKDVLSSADYTGF